MLKVGDKVKVLSQCIIIPKDTIGTECIVTETNCQIMGLYRLDNGYYYTIDELEKENENA
jgi:hypothetical protein